MIRRVSATQLQEAAGHLCLDSNCCVSQDALTHRCLQSTAPDSPPVFVPLRAQRGRKQIQKPRRPSPTSFSPTAAEHKGRTPRRRRHGTRPSREAQRVSISPHRGSAVSGSRRTLSHVCQWVGIAKLTTPPRTDAAGCWITIHITFLLRASPSAAALVKLAALDSVPGRQQCRRHPPTTCQMQRGQLFCLAWSDTGDSCRRPSRLAEHPVDPSCPRGWDDVLEAQSSLGSQRVGRRP